MWIFFVNIGVLNKDIWINMISVMRDSAGRTAGNGMSFESQIAQMARYPTPVAPRGAVDAGGCPRTHPPPPPPPPPAEPRASELTHTPN